MSGFLTHKDKTQLLNWMSRDSQFDLLYKLSRDGVSPHRFHELCDNKGPTVTIFYNTESNVYGGYLSDSWGSTGDWCTDQRAFLFKLYSAGNWKPKKCPYICKETHYKADYCGPWFFSLPSFNSQKEEIISRKNYYHLNIDSFFDGKRFDMNGETARSVANGHNNVTDLGLHDAELNLPWRETPEWNIQTMKELKDFVVRYEPLEEINIQEVNILLLGQVGAGKSSFINTINSIFKGEISSRACSGSEEYCITKKFEKFRIRDHSTKKYLRFRICDTHGVKEGLFINRMDLGYILDGHLPNYYKFQEFSVKTFTKGFVEKPTVGEKMHVVAFVLDSTSLDFLSKNVLSALWKMKSVVVERGIPHVVLLTHIDKICYLEIDNVQKVFTSAPIETAVNKAARTIGIPRSHVLPVKNYEKETLLKTNINILTLTTLRRLLMFADDFLENQNDQEQENAQI